ncbi:4-oxalocrotonate tautomerase family protein [Streptomyces sp. NPDC002917]|uniref:tautomerase family protein n=1 Tax=unclassified Streptomyces TaxID=2593676 RepID=UPI0033BD0951
MPLIQLTTPTGALTSQGRKTIQHTLAQLVMRWQGLPDNAVFRSSTWSYLNELPAGAQTTAEDDQPRFRVDVTVQEGALPDNHKEGLIRDATSAVLQAAGLTDNDALRVWVFIHEQPGGTWGSGGNVVRLADISALAKANPADA